MAATTRPLTLPPGPLATELASLTDTLARCQYRLVGASADFADSNEWVIAGSPTAAHYLAGLADVEVCKSPHRRGAAILCKEFCGNCVSVKSH